MDTEHRPSMKESAHIAYIHCHFGRYLQWQWGGGGGGVNFGIFDLNLINAFLWLNWLLISSILTTFLLKS